MGSSSSAGSHEAGHFDQMVLHFRFLPPFFFFFTFTEGQKQQSIDNCSSRSLAAIPAVDSSLPLIALRSAQQQYVRMGDPVGSDRHRTCN